MSGFNDRRSFLKGGVTAGIASLGAGLVTQKARATTSSGATAGDIAIFKFLAAVELVEYDIWTQYSVLAVNNPGFNRALANIDPSLVRYNVDIRRDEHSHAHYINAGLKAIGEAPVVLDAFRTLSMPRVTGADDRGHLTNLTSLTVDTSWYEKYRSPGNPDFGDKAPQLVDIIDKPAIPTSDDLSEDEFQAIANTATFHSPSIEQGGMSLYNHFLTKATDVDAVAVLASILPVEAIHFTGFHKALENMPGVTVDGLSFPDLRNNAHDSMGIFPMPCAFLSTDQPPISVVRPRSKAQAGAVFLVTALVNSGLFKGQSTEFLDSAMKLAEAADAATRG